MEFQVDNKRVGDRIRQRLKDLRKTQKQLADFCEVEQSAVSGWVRGEYGTKYIHKVAEFLETTVDWLEYEKGAKERHQVAGEASEATSHGLDPYDEAMQAKMKIISICRNLSPAAKAELDLLRLTTKMYETLGFELPKSFKDEKALKKTT